MNRRYFLQAGVASCIAAGAATRKYRAAVIGHTAHGDYGHGIDVVWKVFESVEVVAVADPDEKGLAAARQRIGAPRAYSDYREMLRQEKPDFVSICPRWLDQRVEMVTAAAESGAHIYLEKPFAATVVEADRMVEAVQRAGVKLQLAHQTRLSPDVLLALQMVRDGEIGVIQEMRGRGKEDNRAGGEDLMVLGSHVCDLMRMFAGDPKWVFAHLTLDGHEVTPALSGKPAEPIGPIAGNQVAAMFAFDNGIHGYLASKANDQTHPDRFGIYIFGSKGVVFIPIGFNAKKHPSILQSPRWMADGEHSWQPIQGKSPLVDVPADDRLRSNALMVQDLLQAVKEDRKPVCSEMDGRWTIEMIVGAYQSQMKASRVAFPLADRRHPLQS